MVNEMGKVALRGNIGLVAICANRFPCTIFLKTQMGFLFHELKLFENLR